MTNGTMKPQFPESTRSYEEVALDRAVSELFHELGIVMPAKPQMGMTNIKPADPETFTQKMMRVLQQHAPHIHVYFEHKELSRQKNALMRQLEAVKADTQAQVNDKAKSEELKARAVELAEKIGLVTERIASLEEKLLERPILGEVIITKLETIEALLAANRRQEILPEGKGKTYGREFMKVLQAASPQN